MLLFLSLIFAIPNFQSGKLIKTEVTENISMLLPDNFRAMTDDEIVSKYFTTRRPMAMFTNPELTVDFGVNKSSTNWDQKDLEMMMSFQKSNIYALYDEVNMISEGVKEIKGRNYGYFEFVSVIKPNEGSFIQKGSIRKYTYIQYTIVDQLSLVFNFTCPAQLQQQWGEKAGKIMGSIDIKGKIK